MFPYIPWDIVFLKGYDINLVHADIVLFCTLLKETWVYLELLSVSSRGTCQLFWIKPRSRRIPARELLMIKTCSLGIRVANQLKKNLYQQSGIRELTVLVPSQRKMLLVPLCLNLSPLHGALIYCHWRRTGPLRWVTFTTPPDPPVTLDPLDTDNCQINTTSICSERKEVIHAWCQLVLRCQEQTTVAHPVKQRAGKML